VTAWTSRTVAEVLGLAPPPTTVTFRAIQTDSRSLGPDALFVALRGEHFDGHAFLPAARQAGATGAVVERGTPEVPGLVLFPVADTRVALGRLAGRRRAAITGPVVAITGTNGKTATKEMAARALGTRWRVHATAGNLNNEIGVPLTLLGAPAEIEALVVEAGASVPGEIARLRDIIRPTAAIVTNVSAGHVEGFGGLDGVLREKVALLDGAPLAIVGPEPAALAERARATAEHVLVAGLDGQGDVRPERWTLDGTGRATLTFRGVTVRLPVAGRHQALNAMLVLALAEVLDCDLRAVAAALATVALPGGRWEVHTAGSRTIIHDAYNANPASMAAAFATVEAMAADRPVVLLLGTMLELGDLTRAAHTDVARAALRLRPVLVGAVGEFVAAFGPHAATLGDRLICAADPEALGLAVAPRLPDRAVVLLKASRGVRLERALPHLLDAGEASCSTTS
jgi:UDP-N-acetylmuramoyl-tripeptide--D-alanyl-D-alanine ligase